MGEVLCVCIYNPPTLPNEGCQVPRQKQFLLLHGCEIQEGPGLEKGDTRKASPREWLSKRTSDEGFGHAEEPRARDTWSLG